MSSIWLQSHLDRLSFPFWTSAGHLGHIYMPKFRVAAMWLADQTGVPYKVAVMSTQTTWSNLTPLLTPCMLLYHDDDDELSSVFWQTERLSVKDFIHREMTEQEKRRVPFQLRLSALNEVYKFYKTKGARWTSNVSERLLAVMVGAPSRGWGLPDCTTIIGIKCNIPHHLKLLSIWDRD